MPQAGLRVRLALLALVSPWLLAVGFGVHSRLGGLQEGLLLQLVFVSSDALVLLDGRGGRAGVGIALLALLALVVALERRGGMAARGVAGVEGGIALLGVLAWSGVFAVGVALDRPLFWGGVALWLLARADGRVPAPWTHRSMRWGRLALALAAVVMVLLAGETLLEGPGQHSPPFRLRDLWLAGPGQSALGSGGVWCAGGIAAVVWLGRRRGHAHPGVAAAVVVSVLAAEALRPPESLVLASMLSATGLLLLAWKAPVLRSFVPLPASSPFDPRRLFASLMPVFVWAGLCAARGLTVFMWTHPVPGVATQLADHRDVFSLAIDAGSGAVVYTDRERGVLGVLIDGEDRTFAFDGLAPEEVLSVGPGVVWASLIGPRGSGIVAVDLDTGPLPPAHSVPGGCWIAGLFPLPDPAASAADLPLGTVAVGCEDGPEVWLAKPPLVFDGRRTVRHPVEEAAFAADGSALYTTGLWRGWSLDRVAWPTLTPTARRTIGGFNWTVHHDATRSLVWVGRFFEGNLLALDAETLEHRQTVPLSFGIRALEYEPVHDRLWVAAAYSGRIWSVSASDPSDRRVHALCGQTRDIVAEPRGSVVIASDCGVFRIDEGTP